VFSHKIQYFNKVMDLLDFVPALLNEDDSGEDDDCWGEDVSTRFDSIVDDWDDYVDPPEPEDTMVDKYLPRPTWIGSPSFVKAMELKVDILNRMERTKDAVVKCQCVNYEDARPALNAKVTTDEECPPTVNYSADGPSHAPTWKGVAEYKDHSYETRYVTTKTAVHKEIAHLIMKHGSQSLIDPVAQELISMFFQITVEARGDSVSWLREGNATILTVTRSTFVWMTTKIASELDVAFVQCKHEYNTNFFAYNLLVPNGVIAHMSSKIRTYDWSAHGCRLDSLTNQIVTSEDSCSEIAMKMIRAYAGVPASGMLNDEIQNASKRGQDFRGLCEYWFNGSHIFLLASSAQGVQALGQVADPTFKFVREALSRVYGSEYARHVMTGFSKVMHEQVFALVESRGFFPFRAKYGPTLRRSDVVVPKKGFNDDERCPPLIPVPTTKEVLHQSSVLKLTHGVTLSGQSLPSKVTHGAIPPDDNKNYFKHDTERELTGLQIMLIMGMESKPWCTNQELIAMLRGKGWKGTKRHINKMLHDREGILWKFRRRGENKEWCAYSKQ